MIRKFNTRLLFTDTDSLCYECDEDPREKMYKYKELFDVSNFSVSSKYYCSNNKKVLGKMKEEYGGKSVVKFVGLKPKIYSILDESNNEKSTSKGHNSSIENHSNDDLPRNKPIKLRLLTIIIRWVISEDGKFYPQLFLDDAVYEL